MGDGPVPIRDGTNLGVGKYILYCEVGPPNVLQDRRRRMIAGDSFWKILRESSGSKNSATSSSAQVASDGATAAVAVAACGDSGSMHAESSGVDAAADVHMDAAMDALGAMVADSGDADGNTV